MYDAPGAIKAEARGKTIMRKSILTALVLGSSLAFLGCPPPTEGGKTETPPAGGTPTTGETKTETPPAGETKTEAPKAQKVDLSHVKAGQKYHYTMETSGMQMQQIYEVTEVTDTAVKYKVAMLMKMPGSEEFTAQGEPTAGEWAIPVATTPTDKPADAPEVKMTKETIKIAGQDWECMVSESSGTKTWIPWKNDMATWPMYLKMEGPTKAELTKIE